jgi:hypothetical protein
MEIYTVCVNVVLGVTLFPGKNVAILLAKKLTGGVILTAPSSLFQDVSSRKKKTGIMAAPTSPAVHL